MGWSEGLTPRAVWDHFSDLTQIPRPSHHEERVSAFLAGFGRTLGLETAVDAVGDVLIRKPASAGMENRPGVILQAHMDMVPEKAPGKIHDFETNPRLRRGGLGADRRYHAGRRRRHRRGPHPGAARRRGNRAGPLEAIFILSSKRTATGTGSSTRLGGGS